MNKGLYGFGPDKLSVPYEKFLTCLPPNSSWVAATGAVTSGNTNGILNFTVPKGVRIVFVTGVAGGGGGSGQTGGFNGTDSSLYINNVEVLRLIAGTTGNGASAGVGGGARYFPYAAGATVYGLTRGVSTDITPWCAVSGSNGAVTAGGASLLGGASAAGYGAGGAGGAGVAGGGGGGGILAFPLHVEPYSSIRLVAGAGGLQGGGSPTGNPGYGGIWIIEW